MSKRNGKATPQANVELEDVELEHIALENNGDRRGDRLTYGDFAVMIGSCNGWRFAGIGLTLEDVITSCQKTYQGVHDTNEEDYAREPDPDLLPEETASHCAALCIWQGDRVRAVLTPDPDGSPRYLVTRFHEGRPTPEEPATETETDEAIAPTPTPTMTERARDLLAEWRETRARQDTAERTCKSLEAAAVRRSRQLAAEEAYEDVLEELGVVQTRIAAFTLDCLGRSHEDLDPSGPGVALSIDGWLFEVKPNPGGTVYSDVIPPRDVLSLG